MNMVLGQDIQICTVLSKHVKYGKQPHQLKELHRYTKQYWCTASKNSKASMAPPATFTEENEKHTFTHKEQWIIVK